MYVLGHRDDVVNIFNSLNIIVHPSYANEGVPQTILQAMVMNKAVVASDLPPLREVVIENETGLLTSIKDPESIAAAVIRLINDNGLSRRLGENARKLVMSSYLKTHMLDKIEALYSKERQ